MYTLQRLHKRRSYIFSEQFPTFPPTRLHPGRRTADFLDYDPIQVPFRAKRPPVNLNNAGRPTEVLARKTRARTAVAPLPGVRSFFRRSVHARLASSPRTEYYGLPFPVPRRFYNRRVFARASRSRIHNSYN